MYYHQSIPVDALDCRSKSINFVGKSLEHELGDLPLMGGHIPLSTTWVYECSGQRRQSLLGVSPFNEGFQDTDAHLHLLLNVQNNCATDQSIATKLSLPFVGCSSYTFDLAANKLYAEHVPILDDVNSLMRQFRHQNNYPELVTQTDIDPVKRNVPVGRRCLRWWIAMYEFVPRQRK
ncbi:hypothetical protein PHMEG_0006787 [Phytophthora megakarya]|uniref:Uncharacterized protein n=1 Tax=Phytophthora megakarya TaxID=4795 RepID=A0A225WPW0_9STRA|nr:hypothetical protein PHMEG_0006787 [Phytophthora megakarya]